MTSLSTLLALYKKLQKWLLIIAWVLLSVILDSRSLLTGSFILLSFNLIKEYREFFNGRRLIALGFILLISWISIASLYKAKSSHGRILIYKVASEILYDNGISGIGWGKFKSIYPLYQQKYFAARQERPNLQEVLLADNTYYLFNDYLEFILEMGLKGLLIVILFFVLIAQAFYSFYSAPKSVGEELCFLVLIPLIVAGLFTHLADSIIVRVIFYMTFPGLIYHRFASFERKKSILKMIYAFLLISLIFYNKEYILLYKSHEKLSQAKILALCGYSLESLKLLDSVDEQVKLTPDYRSTYGKLLVKVRRYTEAILLLRMGSTQLPSSETSALLGICYSELKNYQKAEFYLKSAIQMTPNRFVPRSELLSIYVSQNRHALARKMANDILKLPVKIKSQKVLTIKSIAFAYLKSNQYKI